ncbi:MAG: hypothetical protein CL610_06125 [Anaerolineaceae bacterium]|nr:hypothetical protein [Anaerolineaceae bacterium]
MIPWTEMTIDEAQAMYGRLGYVIEQVPPQRGSFKQVFRAQYKNSLVALKVLHRLDGELYKRTQREVDLMMEIDSRYVAKVLDYNFGAPGYKGYIAEEYISGISLDAKARQRGLRQDEMFHIIDNIFQALLILESANHNVVHRDVKPSNIMMRENGDAVLTDFGLARALDESTITSSGMQIGTLRYSPPEFLHYHSGSVDQTSDLFSLGIMFYEFLSSHHPFLDPNNGGSLAEQMLKSPPKPLDMVNPSIDPKLARFVMRLIERDRVNRYPSIAEAYNRFKRFL